MGEGPEGRRDSIRRGRRGWGALLAIGASVVVALLAAPMASAQQVADAKCPGPATSNRFAGFSAFRWAETFTAIHTGTLAKETISVERLTANSSADYIFQLYTASGGVPTNTLLASKTVPSASVPVGITSISATFSPAPAVTAGHQYAVSVTRPGADTDGNGVGTVAPGVCPNPIYLADVPPNPFSPEGSGDEMVFSTFVTLPPPPASPSPSPPAATGERANALKKCKKKRRHRARKRCRKHAKKLPL